MQWNRKKGSSRSFEYDPTLTTNDVKLPDPVLLALITTPPTGEAVVIVLHHICTRAGRTRSTGLVEVLVKVELPRPGQGTIPQL